MPRDTLTREQIVTAAIELMDADGLDGLNMRALGRRLGSAATAVYWHVGSKGNLIALAADQAWHEIALPDPATTGWRGAAAAMATGQLGHSASMMAGIVMTSPATVTRNLRRPVRSETMPPVTAVSTVVTR